MQVSPAASPRKDGGQARAALAAAQKELADTRAALDAQKLTNSGLQARLVCACPDHRQCRPVCSSYGMVFVDIHIL